MVAAVLAPHFKRGQAPDPRDYMLSQPPEREMTPEETAAHLLAVLGAAAPVRAPEEG